MILAFVLALVLPIVPAQAESPSPALVAAEAPAAPEHTQDTG